MNDDTVSWENVRASNVTGTNVYNGQGDHLGQVDDIVIGKKDGTVKYAILSIGGFLGLGKDYHPVPWAELTYSEDQDGFVISRTQEQLADAPRYSADDEPNWNDRDYGKRVHDYYGLPYGLP
ncbi:Sporulation protein YlmC, PRC-barrel domain family [Mesorhizobium albiziae]|uniref:Sporulation protein YlmC, PRC-barrel domain family n=1 Tax=Neomesorhizobium albiziae TaxID=335020 RepID=A0A1I4CSE7_9HYPH|nr:PRC-barrel domain-containing protein [Mesorhizobium albiziae]GLS30946.1 photosystem reaction center subunit H [Mesorhizobium albiziae]SFK83167.1 Sporulation protein YlmC, PRC-barrel domain family [Mesorhizobium albiziae]